MSLSKEGKNTYLPKAALGIGGGENLSIKTVLVNIYKYV